MKNKAKAFFKRLLCCTASITLLTVLVVISLKALYRINDREHPAYSEANYDVCKDTINGHVYIVVKVVVKDGDIHEDNRAMHDMNTVINRKK